MPVLKKAKLYNPETPSESFYVQFNPTTLSYSIAANQRSDKKVMAAKADSAAAEPQLQGDPTGRSCGASLSVKLFYHTYVNEETYTDVRQDINRIRAFLRHTDDENGISSPKIVFAWGTITQIGTLDSLEVTYQMFAADGTPVQAEVSITIFGDDPEVKMQAVNRAAQIQYDNDVRGDASDGINIRWLFETNGEVF